MGGGRGIPLPYARKKSRYELNGGLNLNTDLIVSKTKVKSSQNPIALVQDYDKISILWMIGIY